MTECIVLTLGTHIEVDKSIQELLICRIVSKKFPISQFLGGNPEANIVSFNKNGNGTDEIKSWNVRGQ